MKLNEVLQLEISESSISPMRLSIMNWYHGGSKFERFDTSSIGMGEGNHLLGPGIYFTTDKADARFYTKYARTKEKVLYEVELRFTGVVYNAREKMDDRTRQAFQNVAEDLGLDSYQELYDVKGQSNMIHGMGLIGGVFKLAGKSAFNLLKRHKIQAQYEQIDPRVYEISVYDPSIIEVVGRETIT